MKRRWFVTWHAPYKLQFFTRLCFMTLQVSQVKHGALKSHCLSIRQAMLIEEQTNRENTFSFPRLYSCMKRFNYHDLDFYNYSEFLKAAILLRNHHHHNAAPVLIWLFNRLENDLINKSDHYQDHSTWTILYTGRKLQPSSAWLSLASYIIMTKRRWIWAHQSNQYRILE